MAEQPKKDAADKQRDRAAARSRENFSAVADVGEIPKPKNPRRRKRCEKNLLKFLVEYFPHSTGLKPFSADHKKVIGYLQRCILVGGLFAQAIFRGFAKTTIGELACLWAALYGHRKYVVLFGAKLPDALAMLDSIKAELETNDLLAEDFPEVCLPILALEGKPQRCASQTINGERTFVEWSSDTIVLPTVAGSAASSAVIRARGILGSARGMKYKRPDGENARPDLFIGDDLQTDDSAASPDQVAKRLRIIRKSWLRLSGHHTKIAGVVNGTVIEPDDLMDQLTTPSKDNAAWQSQRIKMVKAWASRHDDLWLGKYADLRSTYNSDDPADQARAHAEATAFYKKNRKAMDAGCQVAWEHCYDETEISAIQHAYNILIDDGEEAFAAECNSDPIRRADSLAKFTAQQVREKVNGFARLIVPSDAIKLTAFIDQQDKLLYWMVCAWADGFTGYVIDYGSWPDQKRSYYTLSDSKRTLRRAYPGRDDEGALWQGMEDLTLHLLERKYKRSDGGIQRLNREAIDGNYGKRTVLIKRFIEHSRYGSLILASFGRAPKPNHKPISQWDVGKGGEKGDEWALVRTNKRESPNLNYDVNYWKKRASDGLALAMGSKGCISLFKAPPDQHRMLGDHCVSEFGSNREIAGCSDVEFEKKPNADNHLWDCLVGNMMLASVCGIRRPEQRPLKPRKPRKKVSYL